MSKSTTRKPATRRPTPAQTARQRRADTIRLVWRIFGVCTAISIAFNVKFTSMHTLDPLALITAAVWPVAAVVGPELVTRVEWANGRVWAFARYGGLGAATVAAMANSMGHTYTVLQSWGQGWVAAASGPIVIDGTMVIAGAALLAMHAAPKRRQKPAAQPPASKPRTRKRTAPVSAPVPQLALA